MAVGTSGVCEGSGDGLVVAVCVGREVGAGGKSAGVVGDGGSGVDEALQAVTAVIMPTSTKSQTSVRDAFV